MPDATVTRADQASDPPQIDDPRVSEQNRKLRRARRLGQIVGSAVLLGATLAGLFTVLMLWTDHEWYASVGQDAVFWTSYASVGAVWAAFTVINFIALFLIGRSAWHTVGAAGRFQKVTALAAIIAAAAMAGSMAGRWMVFRLAVAQSPFGIPDPQFNLDAGFFVFTLPALELLTSWAFQLVLLLMAAYLTIVFISSRLDFTGEIKADWWAARRIFWRLGALLMVVTAGSYGLQVVQLSYSTSRTSYVGASFTDVNATLPGYLMMAIASLAVAVVLLVTSRGRSFKPVLWAFAGLLALSLVAVTLAPTAVQRFWATPNEASVERPYLTRNIAMTRIAYQLDQVDAQDYSGTPMITGAESAAVRQQSSEAPVWTAATVSQAFNQLQTIRPYYQLSPISTDRYQIGGRLQQVLVSAREISSSKLAAVGNTWVNRRLVYTHGYGLAISSASATTSEGFPKFLVGDVPSKLNGEGAGDKALRTLQPRIYFGPDQSDWVVVNAGIDEFDYPDGETNATNRYAGGDGVKIAGPLNRLAWALRLRSVDLLVSSYLTDDSRILLNRSVMARANKIAPWLSYDTPYPALVDGRITWIIDAYTTSDHFPYSQSLPNSSPFPNGTNYVRSSVKVTVDAETGVTTFYAVGADPIRDAWERIFPQVISHDPVPASLAAHLRVPMNLFQAQTQVFATYHVSDPTVFYNQEDPWRIPSDAAGKTVNPQYVLLDRPNGRGLYLVQPYVLPNRDDLVGWLTSSSEPGSYGSKTVYRLPKGRVILGAAQIGARINQDPAIAQQLTLWNQPASTVKFGTMLVLPMEEGTVYLQPLFLQAQNSAITEQVGVIAVNGDKVCLGKNLDDALAKAFSS